MVPGVKNPPASAGDIKKQRSTKNVIYSEKQINKAVLKIKGNLHMQLNLNKIMLLKYS